MTHIKTKTFDVQMSYWIKELYKHLDLGDYDLDFVPDPDKVAELVTYASKFVNVVQGYVNCLESSSNYNDTDFPFSVQF